MQDQKHKRYLRRIVLYLMLGMMLSSVLLLVLGWIDFFYIFGDVCMIMLAPFTVGLLASTFAWLKSIASLPLTILVVIVFMLPLTAFILLALSASMSCWFGFYLPPLEESEIMKNYTVCQVKLLLYTHVFAILGGFVGRYFRKKWSRTEATS